jgi:hypothetical protein
VDAPTYEAPEEAASQDEADEDADLVQRAKECYRLGMDATAQWRQDALVDLEFLAGDVLPGVAALDDK